MSQDFDWLPVPFDWRLASGIAPETKIHCPNCIGHRLSLWRPIVSGGKTHVRRRHHHDRSRARWRAAHRKPRRDARHRDSRHPVHEHRRHGCIGAGGWALGVVDRRVDHARSHRVVRARSPARRDRAVPAGDAVRRRNGDPDRARCRQGRRVAGDARLLLAQHRAARVGSGAYLRAALVWRHPAYVCAVRAGGFSVAQTVAEMADPARACVRNGDGCDKHAAHIRDHGRERAGRRCDRASRSGATSFAPRTRGGKQQP